jgi:hypothetical protein
LGIEPDSIKENCLNLRVLFCNFKHREFIKMKKSLLLLFTFSSVSLTFGQKTVSQPISIQPQDNKVKWTVGNEYMPGHIQAFQENKGQFLNTTNTWKVLYGADYQGSYILLTDHGIITIMPEMVPLTENEIKVKKTRKAGNEKQEELEEENQKKVIYHTVSIEFDNSNSGLTVEGADETPYHFGALDPLLAGKSIDNIRGFKKLVYHNLYPGIDVEFTFHEGKGIEYTINVAPGADPSVFKMKYSGQQGLNIDKAGNIHIKTPLGDILDHAPISNQNSTNISSWFVKTGNNEVGFKIVNYNPSLPLTIDPWLVTPTSIAYVPYDCGMDSLNNVYVMGSAGTVGSLTNIYVQKYTSSGALSWTYILSQYTSIGNAYSQSDMTVDPSGNSYIPSSYSYQDSLSQQYAMIKLNPNGTLNYFYNTYPGTYTIFETWNVSYSPTTGTLIEAGCPNIYQQQLALVNPANGTLSGYSSNTTDQLGEIYTGCIAPNGLYYAVNANPAFCPTFNTADSLVCYSITGGVTKELWSTNTDYTYDDYDFKSMFGIPTNGIAAGCLYLYTSDGYHLDQRNLTNGKSIKHVIIPNGDTSSCNSQWTSGLIPANSGIAVDNCGNVYVGSKGKVVIYDQNLNLITTNGTYTGYVFDVAYNNGLIAACGADTTANSGFVTQFAGQSCSNSFTITRTNTSCGNNNGTATIEPSGPYTYLWSPGGQTTQTVTGLAAGTYTVTINASTSCNTVLVTDTVQIRPSTMLNLSTTSSGGCSGMAGALTTGGEAPYTYAWSSGQTSSSISGVPKGTYTVTVTDAYGCIQVDSAKIDSALLVITPSQKNDSCYGNSNGTITINASGGTAPYTYSWNSGQTTSGISGLPAGTYTCNVTEHGGCSGNVSVTISQPAILASSAPNQSVCPGVCVPINPITSGGTSPYTYTWSNGQTTSSITVCPSATTTYTYITRDSKGCTDIVSPIVNINPLPTLSIKATKDTACTVDTIDFIAVHPAGGVLSGKGVTGNNFNPRTVGVGIFSIYYAYTDSNGCSNTDSIRVYVNICAGIEELSALNAKIELYPNPFSQNVTVDIEIDGPITVTLFDMLGQNVSSWTMNKGTHTISTATLANGMYMLQVKNKNSVINRKLVKVN